MIDKTRRRFMWLMASITSLIIAAALIAIYLLTYSNLEATNRARLTANEELRVSDEATINLGEGENRNRTVVVERITSDIGNYFNMMVDGNGQLLTAYSTYTEQSGSEYQTAANIALSGKNYGKTELLGRYWQYGVFRDGINFTLEEDVQIENYPGEVSYIRFVDITESRQMLRTLAITLVGIGLLLFLLFFFFSAYFSKRAIHPMIEVLEKQRQFVADASHELKTPVSIIKTNCSALRANEDQTVAEQTEWLDNIETGANRMSKLIQNLIALVKIEGTDNDVMESQVWLDREIDETLSAFQLIIDDKQLCVEKCYESGIGIVSDPDRVNQVINIILDNAIKYTNQGGTIQLAVIREKKWTYLSVSNTGMGIAKEHLDKIFNRFYRVESARSHDGSHGLGLSIAAAAMEQLGGAISVDSAVNDHTVFTVRFPIKK